jgi:hypothetical protein
MWSAKVSAIEGFFHSSPATNLTFALSGGQTPNLS